MNPRDKITGILRFGDSMRVAGGVPVSIQLEPSEVADRGLRPGQDIGVGRNGETTNLKQQGIEIRIIDGQDGAKYSWERVYPGYQGGPTTDIYGGGSYDQFYAYEINEADDVAVETVHFARFSQQGPWLIFNASASSGDNASEKGHWIRITEATASGGGSTWKGIVYTNNHDGTWNDGDEIRANFTPNGGEVFLNGRDYWATINGSVSEDQTPRTVTDGVTTSGSAIVTSSTASFTDADIGAKITGTGIPSLTTIISKQSGTSVTLSANATATATGVSLTITPVIDYDLYFSLGNDKLIVSYKAIVSGACVTKYDKWLIPAPFDVVVNTDSGGTPL